MPSLFNAGSMRDDDAISAAALDDRVPSKPMPAVPTIDDAIASAKKLQTTADAQQTPDTKFLRSGDILTALGVGVSALLTGGASLAALGAGTAAGLSSSLDRQAQSKAESEQTSEQFKRDTLQIHQMNMQNARQGSSGSLGLTFPSAWESLMVAAQGPAEQFNGVRDELAKIYPWVSHYTQGTIREYNYDQVMNKNLPTLVKQSNTLAEMGRGDQAMLVLGKKWEHLAIPAAKSVFTPGDPLNETLFQYVMTNSQLNDGMKDTIMDQAQLMRMISEDDYRQFIDDLAALPNDESALQKEVSNRMMMIAEGLELPPMIEGMLGITSALLGAERDLAYQLVGNQQMTSVGTTVLGALMRYFAEAPQPTPGALTSTGKSGSTSSSTEKSAGKSESAGKITPPSIQSRTEELAQITAGFQGNSRISNVYQQAEGVLQEALQNSEFLAGVGPATAEQVILEKMLTIAPGLRAYLDGDEQFRRAIQLAIQIEYYGTQDPALSQEKGNAGTAK